MIIHSAEDHLFGGLRLIFYQVSNLQQWRMCTRSSVEGSVERPHQGVALAGNRQQIVKKGYPDG